MPGDVEQALYARHHQCPVRAALCVGTARLQHRHLGLRGKPGAQVSAPGHDLEVGAWCCSSCARCGWKAW